MLRAGTRRWRTATHSLHHAAVDLHRCRIHGPVLPLVSPLVWLLLLLVLLLPRPQLSPWWSSEPAARTSASLAALLFKIKYNKPNRPVLRGGLVYLASGQADTWVILNNKPHWYLLIKLTSKFTLKFVDYQKCNTKYCRVCQNRIKVERCVNNILIGVCALFAVVMQLYYFFVALRVNSCWLGRCYNNTRFWRRCSCFILKELPVLFSEAFVFFVYLICFVVACGRWGRCFTFTLLPKDRILKQISAWYFFHIEVAFIHVSFEFFF